MLSNKALAVSLAALCILLSLQITFTIFFQYSPLHGRIFPINVQRQYSNQVRKGELAEDALTALPNATLAEFQSRLASAEICVVIPTLKRDSTVTAESENMPSGHLHYLSRTILRLYMEVQHDPDIAVLLLNVNTPLHEHGELISLGLLFPIHSASSNERNLRRKEYKDFVSALKLCYKEAPSCKYIMVLQDDALIDPGFFDGFRYFNSYFASDWAYFRPVYPRKWQGYSLQNVPEHLIHLLVGLFVSFGIIYLFLQKSPKEMKITLAFWICVFHVVIPIFVGRQHWVELPKYLPASIKYMFYTISTADKCCMPCSIYPRSVIVPIVDYLETKFQSNFLPIDIALSDFANDHQLETYSILPNTAKHIGLLSSLFQRYRSSPEFN